MIYNNIVPATFKSRPNRFIAICEVDGKDEICHVKNTGRCRELLKEDARVFLQKSNNPLRKTAYDLISVYKGEELFNIDSQAPNKVFFELLQGGGLFGDVKLIKPETTYKSSRFDFYAEYAGKKAFIEVKGVTLEREGVLLFPDAPTERGVKHIKELESAVKDGYEGYIVFVVQTDKAKYFTPNAKTHPEFAKVLCEASQKGVKVLCFSCKTSNNSLVIHKEVQVKL